MTQDQHAATGQRDASAAGTSRLMRRRLIAGWLLICCAMIFAMVVLGGVTRLSHAGLSMVEWDPLFGVLPPLGATQWDAVFEEYKRFPEYQSLHHGMTLEDFKSIYWLEYSHRLWGRVIGVAFLLPFLCFWMSGWIDRRLLPRLLGLFILGGLQGLLGWFMVQSGLVDQPDVNPYRLTAHLGLALLIYGYMFRLALGLLTPRGRGALGPGSSARHRFAGALVALIFLTILSGGFVAGLDAGFVYNTFPLMDGRLVPDGLLDLRPPVRNVFENVATVQFEHRLLAVVLICGVVAFWHWRRRNANKGRTSRAVHGLLAAALIQAGLGIGTLLLVVPMPLAAAHQAGAVALLTMALWVRHELRAA